MKLQNKNRRLDLEFLRGFAVIIVFLFHYNKQIFPYYYVGVDLFFLVSGYVIIKSILSKKTFNIFEFYLKRIKRIYPALFVILSIFILYFLLLYNFNEGEYIDTILSALTSLFGISNYYYTTNPNYFYFSPEIKFLHHTWSLSVEIQFYILIGLILYLLTNLTNPESRLKNIKLCFLLITFASLFFFFISTNKFLSGYYVLPGRLWEFLFGGILYLYSPKKKILNFNLLIIIFFLFFLLLGIFNPKIDYKIIIIFTVIYFALTIAYSNFYDSSGINKIVLFFGKISFSFYLWHLIVLTFYKNTFNNIYFDFSLNFLLSVFLSFLTFIYVEVKFNKKSNLDNYFIKTFKLFLLFALVLIVYLQIFNQNPLPNLRNFVFQKSIQLFNKVKKPQLNNHSGVFVISYDSCHNKYENFSWSVGTNCLIDNSDETLFYIAGNSYGDHIVPTIATTTHQITLYKSRFENCYIEKATSCNFVNLDSAITQFSNISKMFKNKFFIVSLSNTSFSELKIKRLLQVINKDVHVIFMYRHPSFTEFNSSETFERYKLTKNKDFNIIKKLEIERNIYLFDNFKNLCNDCEHLEYKALFNDDVGHLTLETSLNLNKNFEKFIKTIKSF